MSFRSFHLSPLFLNYYRQVTSYVQGIHISINNLETCLHIHNVTLNKVQIHTGFELLTKVSEFA